VIRLHRMHTVNEKCLEGRAQSIRALIRVERLQVCQGEIACLVYAQRMAPKDATRTHVPCLFANCSRYPVMPIRFPLVAEEL
jgi:hypothetical protein